MRIPYPAVPSPRDARSIRLTLSVILVVIAGICLAILLGNHPSRQLGAPGSGEAQTAGSGSRNAQADSTAPQPFVSLANGARITPDAGPRGDCSLLLQNGYDDDAVVRVTEKKNNVTVRWVYIGHNSKLTLRNIAPGTYSLEVSTGASWDRQNSRFRYNAQYYRLENPITLKEKKDGFIVTRENYRLMMQPTQRGNVLLRTITEAEFNQH